MMRAEDISVFRRSVAFAFILFGYIFYSYAWNTIDVLRPYIQNSADLSLQQAGLLYTFQSVGALVGAVVIGQLADRFGRRNLLAIITFGYGFALLAGVAATDFFELALQRFVLGIFLGGVFSVAVGLYVGLFDPTIRGRLASVVGVMFSVGLALQGWIGSFVLDYDWTLMLWIGALPPIFLAALTFIAVPDDRRIIPFGGTQKVAAPTKKLPVAELFTPAYRRMTFMIVLMSGLNFLAAQAFGGWQATYLKDVREFSGADLGSLIASQAIGSIVGSFAWGWIADRFGRRTAALGFFVAAGLIVAYLTAPTDLMILTIIGVTLGFILSSSVVWGPYFAELYPEHLRSTAASVFHWGRIMSFFAPALTAALAAIWGLPIAMGTAALLYLLAATIWVLLPETLIRKIR